LEDVVHSGKAKAIGLSSFLRPHVEAILKVATIKPVVNQIEFHPYLQRANNYVPWLQEQGIAVQSFFGLAPITWAKGGPLDPVLSRIAKQHNVDQSAVLFRWQLNQEVISISTTKKAERLDQYLAALDLKLTDDEQKEITEVGLTHHFRIRLSEKFALYATTTTIMFFAPRVVSSTCTSMIVPLRDLSFPRYVHQY
jgi:diketogulonate reductase-like aldo/keto reductase